MAFAKVVLNRDGVGDVLTSGEVESALLAIATDAAATARSRAPVDSGRYRDSISARIVPGRSRRAAAEVVADVPYATIIESRLRILGSSLGDGATAKRKYKTRDGRTILATQAQIDNWTRFR